MPRVDDRRNRQHPLGTFCDAVPLATRGQLARMWGVSSNEAWGLIGGYLRRDLLGTLALGCRLIDPPAAPTYRHEPDT